MCATARLAAFSTATKEWNLGGSFFASAKVNRLHLKRGCHDFLSTGSGAFLGRQSPISSQKKRTIRMEISFEQRKKSRGSSQGSSGRLSENRRLPEYLSRN